MSYHSIEYCKTWLHKKHVVQWEPLKTEEKVPAKSKLSSQNKRHKLVGKGTLMTKINYLQLLRSGGIEPVSHSVEPRKNRLTLAKRGDCGASSRENVDFDKAAQGDSASPLDKQTGSAAVFKNPASSLETHLPGQERATRGAEAPVCMGETRRFITERVHGDFKVYFPHPRRRGDDGPSFRAQPNVEGSESISPVLFTTPRPPRPPIGRRRGIGSVTCWQAALPLAGGWCPSRTSSRKGGTSLMFISGYLDCPLIV
ncbi:unnamed protein product [Pleuronectes platessa]|uniref:Uncharacterized protein n=1 Tax=Pleuronectes platessa TaxID=8262 RepID=A0A9N7UKD5_PLEPL|nr:unnamed protein product [Pleuronectes platessa]